MVKVTEAETLLMKNINNFKERAKIRLNTMSDTTKMILPLVDSASKENLQALIKRVEIAIQRISDLTVEQDGDALWIRGYDWYWCDLHFNDAAGKPVTQANFMFALMKHAEAISKQLNSINEMFGESPKQINDLMMELESIICKYALTA